MNVSLSGIEHAYARLAPRERTLVQIAVGVLVALVAWGAVSWLQKTKQDLRRGIAAKERQLEEVQQLRKTYLQLKQQTEALTSRYSNRPQNFSLFSFLEGVGSKTVSREKILAMSPSSKTVGDQFVEESVEMRLSGVTLAQIVGLLHEVDNSAAPLRVPRLQMKKRLNEPYQFDVVLVVSSIKSA